MVNSTYVDDFAAGAENEIEVIALYYELTSLMRQIRLPMAKWASNSTQLKTVWTAEGQRFNAETQVLGVDWNTETDTFSIDHEVITDKVTKEPTTKRNLLKAAATLYDPLGLFLSLGKYYSRIHGVEGWAGMNSYHKTLDYNGTHG